VRLRELGRERFPDDKLAAKITVREAFNAKETLAYAADLDTQVEKPGLEAAHTTTRLREELRQVLREEGSDACGNEHEDDDYVHLDDNDLDAYFLADLPTDARATEAAAEQRALMASFEM
jgi:hypothetical protein